MYFLEPLLCTFYLTNTDKDKEPVSNDEILIKIEASLESVGR